MDSAKQEEQLSAESGKVAMRSVKVNNDSLRSADDALTAIRTGEGVNS